MLLKFEFFMVGSEIKYLNVRMDEGSSGVQHITLSYHKGDSQLIKRELGSWRCKFIDSFSLSGPLYSFLWNNGAKWWPIS